jgi:hypothetical protein
VDQIGEHHAGALAAMGVDRIAGKPARLAGRQERAPRAQLASGEHHVRAGPPERRADLAHELIRVPAGLGARAVGQYGDVERPRLLLRDRPLHSAAVGAR